MRNSIGIGRFGLGEDFRRDVIVLDTFEGQLCRIGVSLVSCPGQSQRVEVS